MFFYVITGFTARRAIDLESDILRIDRDEEFVTESEAFATNNNKPSR